MHYQMAKRVLFPLVFRYIGTLTMVILLILNFLCVYQKRLRFFSISWNLSPRQPENLEKMPIMQNHLGLLNLNSATFLNILCCWIFHCCYFFLYFFLSFLLQLKYITIFVIFYPHLLGTVSEEHCQTLHFVWIHCRTCLPPQYRFLWIRTLK